MHPRPAMYATGYMYTKHVIKIVDIIIKVANWFTKQKTSPNLYDHRPARVGHQLATLLETQLLRYAGSTVTAGNCCLVYSTMQASLLHSMYLLHPDTVLHLRY